MLESIVWSLFEQYAAKYIKGFRPEELKISLWEGEITMQNVELNTQVRVVRLTAVLKRCCVATISCNSSL